MNLRIGFILLMLAISCGNKKSISGNSAGMINYMNEIIKYKMETYIIKAPDEYKELVYYKRSIMLVNKTDSLCNKVIENSIIQHDLDSYIKFMTRFDDKKYYYGKTNFIGDLKTIDLKKIILEDGYKDEVLQKIKVIELMIIDKQLEYFLGTYFEIDVLSTIYKPKSAKIKLGQTYEAEIFLAAENTRKPFIYMVDGDTIQVGSLEHRPIFKVTPTSKGEKTHKGCVINTQYGFKYEFDIKYTVE